MKKILYIITQSELGGAQRYIFDLADNLKGEFNISVAFGSSRCSSSETDEQGDKNELAKQLDKIGIKYYTIPHLKRAISPINDFLTIIEIIKLIKKLKPDIIHLNSSKVSILGSTAAKICYVLRVPCYVIYTVHGWVFNEPLSPIKKTFYKYAEKFTALFKDKIICISKLDYEIAKNQLKIPEKKLTLIHHGIRQINFLPREQARQKLSQVTNYQLPVTNIIISTIANLYKTKGLEYFIETIKILTTNYELPITAIVIGEGDERKNLENMIGQNSLKSKFFIAGKIKNAAELLPAFDVYVCSSVKEGFPYSILEAMSAGLPIISTNVGGIPKMINDKKSGLLVKPKNPQVLADKIKILIEDKKLRDTLGEQAKKNVKEKFNIEKMIEKTKEVYLK